MSENTVKILKPDGRHETVSMARVKEAHMSVHQNTDTQDTIDQTQVESQPTQEEDDSFENESDENTIPMYDASQVQENSSDEDTHPMRLSTQNSQEDENPPQMQPTTVTRSNRHVRFPARFADYRYY